MGRVLTPPGPGDSHRPQFLPYMKLHSTADQKITVLRKSARDTTLR